MGNQFNNVAVIACLKTFLFIFNTVFWLSGLWLLLVGLWAEFDLYKYLEVSPDYSSTGPHVVLGIAGLILVVTSVAFSCIIKGQPVLLYVYGGFLSCIFIMDAGVGASVTACRDTFPKVVHDTLTHSVRTADTHKRHFDVIQATLACCGVANYTDWVRLSPQRVIPLSCCVDPKSCVTANYSDVYQRGCSDVIVEYFQSNINVIVGVAIGMAVFPLIGTIFSCSLAYYIKKSKYDSVN